MSDRISTAAIARRTGSDGAAGSAVAQVGVHYICVNFNGALFTRAWLASVFAQREAAPEVQIKAVIVDNASSTAEYGELQAFCEGHEAVQVVRSDTNVGYFGGLNLGLEAITAAPQDYLVIGNNDLVFAPDFTATLLKTRYRPEVMVVCPDLKTADGVHQNPHVPDRTSWFRRLQFDVYFSHYVVGLPGRWLARRFPKSRPRGTSHGVPREICMGVGACYVLLPGFLTRIPSLYFPAFLYGEEACLSWQVRSAGGIEWYDPALKVEHAESAACSKLPSRTAYEYGREAYWRYRQLL